MVKQSLCHIHFGLADPRIPLAVVAAVADLETVGIHLHHHPGAGMVVAVVGIVVEEIGHHRRLEIVDQRVELVQVVHKGLEERE